MKINTWMVKLNARWLSKDVQQGKHQRSCKNGLFTWAYSVLLNMLSLGYDRAFLFITSLTVK